MARNPFGPPVRSGQGFTPVRRNPFPSRQIAVQQAPRTNGGVAGLLQKVLNRGGGAKTQTAARAALPASTSTSSGISLLDMVNHTQSALKAAESFMPMVQEYGPMVKNLPSMLKMMKALKDIDFDEEEEKAAEKAAEGKTEESMSPSSLTDKKESELDTNTASVKKETKKSTGASLPKLYI
ncbi:YqfQ family protein [Terribacillus sp. DMT04]|uniref:YqfQ family protein n=1 Tax=Terribacillus sp. DMT04 TaxID=2850441 RepID=UPI001C2BA47B|nr:YqfQ family protein [Terribacillus sp. DMT04]QXE00210.1 YqfQ family protein [Terribacillus sp. DMT04]